MFILLGYQETFRNSRSIMSDQMEQFFKKILSKIYFLTGGERVVDGMTNIVVGGTVALIEGFGRHLIIIIGAEVGSIGVWVRHSVHLLYAFLKWIGQCQKYHILEIYHVLCSCHNHGALF